MKGNGWIESREVHSIRRWSGLIISSHSLICSSSGLLLLLVRNPSSLSLTLPHLSKVHPYGATSKRVSLRGTTIFLISSPQPSNESIKATPRLPERARARRWRLRLAIEHATLEMNLSLPKLVKIAKEIQHMVAIALR